jgi:hypothetical protein
MREVNTVIKTLAEIVEELRKISPLARANRKQED